jgi:flagellar biosynthesis regulator FlaF
MKRHIATYQATQYKTAPAQRTEIEFFIRVNALLGNARTKRERIEALSKNQRLWSALVRDLALPANRLPEPLKNDLISLGVWAMRYSTEAMARELPLDPLISVNRNIIEGLEAQAAHMPPEAEAKTAQMGLAEIVS